MKKRILKLLKEILLVLAIGNIIGLLLNIGSTYNTGVFINFSMGALFIGFPLMKGYEFIISWQDKRISWLEFPIKRFVQGIVLMTVYALLVILVTNYIILVLISGLEFDRFVELATNTFFIALIITIIVTLVVNAVFFFQNWKKTTIQKQQLENERLSFEYEVLKSQVNPHFLFNSLNTLTALVEDNNEAVRFIKKLSDIYRYVLEQRNNEVISFDEELAFTKAYIYLQKIRFEDTLLLEMDIEKAYGSMIIPLSLQILVENAIKHNYATYESPLQINISVVDDYIVVTNNLQPKKKIRESTGIGLSNIKSRYKYLSGKEVVVEKTDKQFIVKLPLLKRES